MIVMYTNLSAGGNGMITERLNTFVFVFFFLAKKGAVLQSPKSDPM